MVNVKSIAFLLLLLSFTIPAFGSSSPPPSLSPESNDYAASPSRVSNHGTCVEWVHQFGYECEEHTVKTKDGFILSIQRIQTSLNTSFEDSSLVKTPILLQHGVFVDGTCFMFVGGESLAFYLADKGFDVWVANSRGTVNSLAHESLNSSQKKFWDWSVDELVEYDFAATVDYVHAMTAQKVHLIAHSMGTLISLSALSSNIPAVKNLRSASMLSPIGHLNHIYSPFAVLAENLFLAETGELIGLSSFNPAGRPAAELSRKICNTPGVDCSFLFTPLTGPNCCLTDAGVENYLTNTQQTSMKVLVHLSQNVRGGGMTKFDYGEIENKKLYGSVHPPIYDVAKIPKNLPMFLSYGGRDSLSDFVDVGSLIDEMKDHDRGKLVTDFQMNYAHVDFLMATNVVDRVYKRLVSFIESN